MLCYQYRIQNSPLSYIKISVSEMENVEKLFRLEAEEELRVEVDCGKTDKVTVELKSGLAEIFGTEMVINTK